MNKRITLNICPPAVDFMPTAGVTALKSVLVKNGYSADIIYWNLDFEQLQKDFIFNTKSLNDAGIVHSQLLFLNYFALEKNDEDLYNTVKHFILALKPEMQHIESGFFDSHMLQYKEKVDAIINGNIIKYHLADTLCFGFSIKLDQWLVGAIIGEKFKKLFPDKKIIVGGLNTKIAAINVLNNFPQFDVAAWGEGEMKLLSIVEALNIGLVDLSNIPNIAYKIDSIVMLSTQNQTNYVDLSEQNSYYDFSDYFAHPKIKNTEYNKIVLPLENSRGCHWGKCHFCYLNVGYKYREKDISKLKAEIFHYINQYGVTNFAFLDNDLIGNDLNRFNKLLDCFIDIRNDFPKFRIVSAEVITKGLNGSIIKKMAEAGIFVVQIGWESSSNELLRKIDKKNTFASNLAFLKFATKYHIRLSPLNVIANLLEETDADINEAIENIKFLRFFRHDPNIIQTTCSLTINATSKYCIKPNDIDVNQYEPYNWMHQFMKKYVSKDCAWNLFDYLLPSQNKLWKIFDQIELYYKTNKYSYKSVANNGVVSISEFKNYQFVSELCIKVNSIEHIILTSTHEVISFDKLRKTLNDYFPNQIDDNEVIDILNDYHKKGFIYHSDDYEEILSVINFH